MTLLIFLGSISVAWAQVQSHPLSQISPIDSNLNMYTYNSSVGYLNYSYGILSNGTQGILTADIASSAVTGSRIASNAITSSKISNPLGGLLNATAYYDSDNSNYFLDPAATGISMALAGNLSIGSTAYNQGYDNLHIDNGQPPSIRLSNENNGNNNYAQIYDVAANSVDDSGTNYKTGGSLFVGISQNGCLGSHCDIYDGTNQLGAAYMVFHGFSTHSSYNGNIGFYTRNAGVTSSVMTISNNSNVGIGTTSPTTLLDVAGTIRSTAQTIPTSGAGLELIYTGGTGYVSAYNRSLGSYNLLILNGAVNINGTSGNVGIGTTSPLEPLDVKVAANTHIGLFTSGGTAGIGGFSDGFVGWQNITINTGGGNVGIGTASPQARLSLGTGVGAKLLMYDNGGGINGGFFIDTPNLNDMTLAAHSAGALVFGKTTSAAAPTFGTEWMRITNAGNVGINSPNPGSKMTVNGGDVFVATQGNGVIIHDSDGAGCHRITVNTAGTISAASVTCPSS